MRSVDSPATLIALLHGPDKPGLVARVAGWIFERGGNILHADQHRDNVDDLVRKGRDLEKRVLAYGRKTVVFD